MQSIFVYEDDENIRELVVYALKSAGYAARGFDQKAAFWNALEESDVDLILLDIMLPDEDGVDVLREIRSNPDMERLPVIMLTAKSSEFDKVKALDVGADDYVTKPFGVMELISRVKAVLRRAGNESFTHVLTAGAITLDTDRHIVTANDIPVSLTLKEFELLECLIQNKGLVMSRDKLITQVWGFDFEGETRTIDMHIKTLRQKLGEAAAMIETVRGIGYKLEIK